MEFITERIANLRQHQDLVEDVCVLTELLNNQLDLSAPTDPAVKDVLKALVCKTDSLRNFEFLIEKRKVNYCK